MTSTIDLFTGLFLIVFSVAAHIYAGSLPEVTRGLGPGDYPRVVLKGILVLGTILAATSVYHLRKSENPNVKKFEKGEFRQVVILVICIALYTALVRFFGFIILTPLFMFMMMLIFGLRKWVRMIVISVITTAVTYYLFNNLLLVLLPRFRLF
jgi:hypothetical protein